MGEARATVVAMQTGFDGLAAAHAVALVTAAAKERETALTTQNAMLAKIVEEGSEAITALEAQMLSREARAAEQFRHQSQHHGSAECRLQNTHQRRAESFARRAQTCTRRGRLSCCASGIASDR